MNAPQPIPIRRQLAYKLRRDLGYSSELDESVIGEASELEAGNGTKHCLFKDLDDNSPLPLSTTLEISGVIFTALERQGCLLAKIAQADSRHHSARVTSILNEVDNEATPRLDFSYSNLLWYRSDFPFGGTFTFEERGCHSTESCTPVICSCQGNDGCLHRSNVCPHIFFSSIN